MFWSLILEPGKKYSSTVKESFHLSMATLDVKSAKNDNDIYPVQLEIDNQELLLCNLSKPLNLQVSLDLMFEKGTEITLTTSGKATIHLTGYVIDDSSDDYSESEDEDQKAKYNKLMKKLGSSSKNQLVKKNDSTKSSPEKRKLEPAEVKAKKKAKIGKEESSEDEDESDSVSDLEDTDLSKLGIKFSDDDEDEDDDADDDDGDDDSLSDEEDEDDDDDDDDDDGDDDSSEDGQTNKKVVQTPKSNKKQNEKTPVQDKKQQMKTPVSNKKLDGKQDKSLIQKLTNGATPLSEKKSKDKKTPKSEMKTPKGNESPLGTQQTPKKQTVEGGVIIEELKPGNGPVAKPGRMVAVYYTGRLKNNNRVFDQTNNGPGFKFRLGKGEVIKAWDVALNGMKVGSKRRITCPPAMAYGNKGSPPSIPPNSTLIFDVELKNVN